MMIVENEKGSVFLVLLAALLIIGMITIMSIGIITEKNSVESNNTNIVVVVSKSSKTMAMITKLNPKVSKEVVRYIAKEIEKSAEKYNLSVPLVVSLIFRESGFNPLAISKSKCIGLMQINPKAHPKKIKPYKYVQLYHIDVNIDIGCQILREYLDKKKTIKGTLESYLGANNKGYIMDILSTCIDLQQLQHHHK